MGGKQPLLFHGEAFLVGNSGEGPAPLILKGEARFWLANVHSGHSADHGFLGYLFEFSFHDPRPFLQRKDQSKLLLRSRNNDSVKLANVPGAE